MEFTTFKKGKTYLYKLCKLSKFIRETRRSIKYFSEHALNQININIIEILFIKYNKHG